MLESDPQPIQVILAEDHTIVREGLRALLAGQADICVVGEAADGRGAVELARRLRPQVVVMDLTLPQLNGVDATRRIIAECPRTRVLVLSMHLGEEYVRPAVRAGASGYLVKGAGLSDLTAAIRAVAAGGAFFSPQAAEVLLRDAATESPLTEREREVLRWVAEGKSSKRRSGSCCTSAPRPSRDTAAESWKSWTSTTSPGWSATPYGSV